MEGINALDVPADEGFCGVTIKGFKVETTVLAEKLEGVPEKTREMIYALIDLVLKNSQQDKLCDPVVHTALQL